MSGYASSLGASVGRKIKPPSAATSLGTTAGAYRAAAAKPKVKPQQLTGGVTVDKQPGQAGGRPISTGPAGGVQQPTTIGGVTQTITNRAPNPLIDPINTTISDPGLTQEQIQGQRTRDYADSTYQQTIGDLGRDYGYDAQGNVDARNPYGRAALLQHMATDQHRGNTTSYAAGGQLYSGALQNAQDETSRQTFIADDRLRKGLSAGQHAALSTLIGSYQGAADGLGGESYAALIRRLGGTS